MTVRPTSALCAILATGLLLAGCGPHPAAGEWLMSVEDPSLYSRIEIKFDGTAFLFVRGQDDHEVRCLWAGADRSTIDLDCARRDRPSRHFAYQLQVIGNRNGVLIDSGRVIGHYQRKPT